MDPEQVLLNLGFGGAVPATTTMYARIPDRFLQSQDAEAQQDEDGTQEGAPAEGTPRRNPSRGQCPMMMMMPPMVGRSCHSVDSEYYTYILNRVPAYFFKEKAPSEHSSVSASSSDSEELLPPPSVAFSAARPPGKPTPLTTAGTDGVEDVVVVPGSRDTAAFHGQSPRSSVPDSGTKAPDSVAPESPVGVGISCEGGDGASDNIARFSVEFRPPEEDNISTSSSECTDAAGDDHSYPYGFCLAPNESLV